MSEYVLTLGGPIEDDGSAEFTRFTNLDITEGGSSMGSWTGTLPFGDDFSDEIYSNIWIYYDGELIFRGELESYEADYESAQTTISGRGVLVELDRNVTFVEYDQTTVYDALVDFWADLDYDSIVLPPNRELYDSVFLSNRDHRTLWAWNPAATLNTDGVTIERNRLVFEEPGVVLDDTDDDGYQLQTIETSENTDWISMIVVTDEAVDWLRGGMKQMDGDVVVDSQWETVTHNRPQHYHIFHFEFDSDTYNLFRPMLENDEPIEVVRTEVLAPDKDGFVTIDDVELEGTTFEVLQEIHDLGSYNFAIRDYENKAVDTFPVGTVNVEPDWRITSSTRSKDLTDYANNVTVTGARLDDGTSYTATSKHQGEIDLMQERGIGDDGVIGKYEKSIDLETEQEVEDRADRLLEESINERDESGSLEIVPQMVMPGYSYNVSVWGDAFPYGGQIGQNSLYFDDDSHIEFSYDYDDAGSHWTFEYLIRPDGLDSMGDDEYYTIHEMYGEDPSSWIRLYGDGSIELNGGESNGWRDRSPPGVIRNDDAQRLSVIWGESASSQRVLVNGQLKWETTDVYSSIISPYDSYTTHYVGSDSDGNHGFDGGIDDVRLWTSSDSVQSHDWILEHAFDDLVRSETSIDGLGIYYRLDDSSNPEIAINYGVVGAPEDDNGGSAATIIGAEYQSAIGQLDEVQYSLGTGDTMSLDFDISGRIDTELILAKREVRRNRSAL
ncbi:LamG-like jellyroll fold domain-containing protein [Natronoglomus mannanivorans]|uniref:LamG domain-containing protein n=1 Tax=Natronoglomus mannanivorans TaxID=2979990 RepID=A0AAP2Z3G3_9EURY|nr:LamG domain-containing protein [Halobacteria archaeon AArc-xg1-1]